VRRGDDKAGITNLIDILSVATGKAPGEIEVAYEHAGYGQFKADVGEAVVAMVAPVRERYLELRSDPAELRRLLGAGAERAREAAAPTLERMYDAMGFVRLDK
jgi:tryptophanyl-tRNA synthetase